MLDGSDAVADWALLNALLNTASGASWVSIHNGGGVGIGYSQHAGQVTVADGTKEMAARIERVLTNDPGIGVARHADAGYPEAIEFARKTGVKRPDAVLHRKNRGGHDRDYRSHRQHGSAAASALLAAGDANSRDWARPGASETFRRSGAPIRSLAMYSIPMQWRARSRIAALFTR